MFRSRAQWALCGRKERSLDRLDLVRVHRTPAIAREVARVGHRLRPQDSVHCGHQLDELVDRPVTFLRRERGVMPYHLEFVEDRVLALFLPVIEEHILKQPGQLAVGIDAPAIVKLGEQLDI